MGCAAEGVEMEAPKFECMEAGYMKIYSKAFCKLLVDPVSQSYSMVCLLEHNKTFKCFPMAIEAIDVSFLQADRLQRI